MRIHFVFPRFTKLLEAWPGLADELSAPEVGSFRMAGNGLACAAAALPSGHQVVVTDRNRADDNLDTEVDLAAISCFTPQATDAWRVADRFRAAGVPVIAGGIHPTVCTAEASQRVDSVVRGPVEGLWPRILADLAAGSLAPVYQGRFDAPFAQPKRDTFAGSDYLRCSVVQTARGCHLDCPACVVPTTQGPRVVRRRVAAVAADIADLPHLAYFLGDESLLFADPASRAWLADLAAALTGHRRRPCFTATYPCFLRELDDHRLALLERLGLRQLYLVCGLMAPLARELADPRLVERIVACRDHGIEVLATFTLGHDDDPPDGDVRTLDFCQRIDANLAEFTIHTPFPGTARHAELESQGRLLERDWSHYHGAACVFQPRGRSADDLEASYRDLWRAFYGHRARRDVESRYARGFGSDILRQERPALSRPARPGG